MRRVAEGRFSKFGTTIEARRSLESEKGLKRRRDLVMAGKNCLVDGDSVVA